MNIFGNEAVEAVIELSDEQLELVVGGYKKSFDDEKKWFKGGEERYKKYRKYDPYNCDYDDCYPRYKDCYPRYDDCYPRYEECSSYKEYSQCSEWHCY